MQTLYLIVKGKSSMTSRRNNLTQRIEKERRKRDRKAPPLEEWVIDVAISNKVKKNEAKWLTQTLMNTFGSSGDCNGNHFHAKVLSNETLARTQRATLEKSLAPWVHANRAEGEVVVTHHRAVDYFRERNLHPMISQSGLNAFIADIRKEVPEVDDDQETTLREMARTICADPCILCGAPAVGITWCLMPNPNPAVPTNAAIAIYTLCEACHQLPDFDERVQKKVPRMVREPSPGGSFHVLTRSPGSLPTTPHIIDDSQEVHKTHFIRKENQI